MTAVQLLLVAAIFFAMEFVTDALFVVAIRHAFECPDSLQDSFSNILLRSRPSCARSSLWARELRWPTYLLYQASRRSKMSCRSR
jgi:hypothetical protein